VVPFVVSAVVLALLATLVGRAVDALGDRRGAGGLKHGRQKFSAERSRTMALMLVVAVVALAVPSLTFALHTPAASHERGLSIVTAILLLVLFSLSLPAALAKDEADDRRTHLPHLRGPRHRGDRRQRGRERRRHPACDAQPGR
jgi:Ca2+:H+ antiporter